MLPVLSDRSMQRWGGPFSTAHREFDSTLDRLFNPEIWSGGISYPVDVWEDDDNLYVEAEMPGFKKDEVDVTFENGILSITAERKVAEGAKGQAHLAERRHARYARRFTLPTLVDDTAIDAHLDDGVLYLTLPKKAEVRPRRIALK